MHQAWKSPFYDGSAKRSVVTQLVDMYESDKEYWLGTGMEGETGYGEAVEMIIVGDERIRRMSLLPTTKEQADYAARIFAACHGWDVRGKGESLDEVGRKYEAYEMLRKVLLDSKGQLRPWDGVGEEFSEVAWAWYMFRMIMTDESGAIVAVNDWYTTWSEGGGKGGWWTRKN